MSDKKICMFCGNVTHRKVYNGSPEPIKQWSMREWCNDIECVKKGRAYALTRSEHKPGPKVAEKKIDFISIFREKMTPVDRWLCR